jgi:hypothetical protein
MTTTISLEWVEVGSVRSAWSVNQQPERAWTQTRGMFAVSASVSGFSARWSKPTTV